mmetsp:Transcript_31796/g.93361  ORF Transcript_31796/g.93361 Transcript_31796/m.93361 type:complete len:794 (+) Transcript_31796:49-2430(+)
MTAELAQTLAEHGIPSTESTMTTEEALVYRLLDSVAVDGGLTEEAKKEMATLLKENENAYNALSDCIVRPLNITTSSSDQGEMLPIKRSYRAIKIIEQDVQMASQIQKAGGSLDDIEENDALILNGTRAGLLAKKLFAAYDQKDINEEEGGNAAEETSQPLCLRPHIPHVNHLLKSLLEGYASAVCMAACAGGRDGVEAHLGPMLCYRSLSSASTKAAESGADLGSAASLESPLPTLAAIVTTGCTGRLSSNAATEQTRNQMMNNPMMMAQQAQEFHNSTNHLISKGHRRKFVRSLADWDLLTRLADCIDHPGTDESALYRSEAACDALLSIVDTVGFPPMPPPGVVVEAKKKKEMEESVGEEALLAPLATDDFLHHLTHCVTGGSLNNSLSASRALLGLFDLATGRSKNHSAPPALDAADADEATSEAAKAVVETVEVINKIKKSGLTASMHQRLIGSIDVLVKGIDVYALADGGSIDTRSEESDDGNGDAVRHPGHYAIKQPFTSRRLHLISLLADIVDFDNDSNADADEGKEGEKIHDHSAAKVAIDAIVALPLPPSCGGKAKDENDDVDVVYNPFPGFVDLLFAYPENNLYQIQFYRLLHSLCMTNHEDGLKVLVQKTKFVGRAIKAIKNDATVSNKGVLLRCLNALRLHSQSLSSHSFLRHYLDSHDGWKSYQATLRSNTIEQQRLGGGIPMPTLTGPPPGMMGMASLVDAINSNPLLTSEDDAEKSEELDIDLGSAYANDLGFDSTIKAFVGDDSAPHGDGTAPDGKAEGGSGSAKKKKKSKKKKKK